MISHLEALRTLPDLEIIPRDFEREFSARVIEEAISDLSAPYPRDRLIRRHPGRVRSHGYRHIKPSDLAAERRDFEGAFRSAVRWIFEPPPVGQVSSFDIFADALCDTDAEAIRRGASAILERRKAAPWDASHPDYIPGRLRALEAWRGYKRRLNFPEIARRRVEGA